MTLMNGTVTCRSIAVSHVMHNIVVVILVDGHVHIGALVDTLFAKYVSNYSSEHQFVPSLSSPPVGTVHPLSPIVVVFSLLISDSLSFSLPLLPRLQMNSTYLMRQRQTQLNLVASDIRVPSPLCEPLRSHRCRFEGARRGSHSLSGHTKGIHDVR